MDKQEAIEALQGFIGWFEDNFGEESFLMEVDGPDDTIREEWVSYFELPEYIGACKALDALSKMG